MQMDFHYYATYCAAYLAGYSHRESMEICYSAQFTDCCSRTLLGKLHAPKEAATTQLQLELMDAQTDIPGLQDITRIWTSFHFLPGNLYAEVKRGSRIYKNKYRLICNPNGTLIKDTVELAKNKSLQSVGIAMHVMADTWAHRYFAGTPSLVINNTDFSFTELIDDENGYMERPVVFRHNPVSPDDVLEGKYTNSLYQSNENSVMNLGHGRAGHFPDYSFAKYRYLPAWGNYEEVLKDNPSDYYYAFCQMVYALKYLRGDTDEFQLNQYDFSNVAPWEQDIREIIAHRQIDACGDWKALGELISGMTIDDFNIDRYQTEYVAAPEDEKDNTFLGKFIIAAMAQKSMVCGRIFASGNLLAGYSVKFNGISFKGIKDYIKLINTGAWREKNE